MPAISTHAPLAGRDAGEPERCAADLISTHAPLAGRDVVIYLTGAQCQFQPTRPLRGATRRLRARLTALDISTHAPLAGRDSFATLISAPELNFNPRAPCGARPVSSIPSQTLSRNFNPRAPCGARRAAGDRAPFTVWISTHAPLAGRDAQMHRRVHPRGTFQPTRPLRGATCAVLWACRGISYFNPRAPCGARLGCTINDLYRDDISTHAPLAGRDRLRRRHCRGRAEFQPTRPLRGATCADGYLCAKRRISTHAPLAGRDLVLNG